MANFSHTRLYTQPHCKEGKPLLNLPIRISAGLGMFPIDMGGLRSGSQKPESAVGTAADMSGRCLLREGDQGRRSKEESDCGREMTGGLAGKTNQPGRKYLLDTRHVRTTKVAKMVQEV